MGIGPALRIFFVLCSAAWLWASSGLAAAEPASAATRDTLVFKDGDRVQGQLLRRSDNVIVFVSDRFGEIRVPADQAVVIRAEPPTHLPSEQPVAQAPAAEAKQPQSAAPAAPAPATASERAEQERVSLWNRFSPAVLTAAVREFFGPWHGRISLSNDLIVDTAERSSLDLDAKIARSFRRDTVELTARYDYDQTNNVKITDTLKSSGVWRHEFNRRYFGQYRPTVEWNRASLIKNVRTEYVLLQQEIGFGVNLLSRPARKFRVGISENVFDLWAHAPVQGHSFRAVESLFDELELALPWRMTLTQRGIWYPVWNDVDGWENRVELNKKLTETLSVALRQELRRNNPDGASPDYTRLRLLLGLDF